MSTSTDTVVLLSLLSLVAAFVAFEEAGLRLPGWHTISYMAAHNPALFWMIFVAFSLTGIVGPIWWWFHIHGGIAR